MVKYATSAVIADELVTREGLLEFDTYMLASTVAPTEHNPLPIVVLT